MAQAFAEHHLGKGVEAYSGGSNPARSIHPEVVEVMREKGIDLSAKKPKSLREVAQEDLDLVVALGCGDACPQIGARKRVDWTVDDPSGKPIEAVRRIRDEIEQRIVDLGALYAKE